MNIAGETIMGEKSGQGMSLAAGAFADISCVMVASNEDKGAPDH